MPKYAVVIVPIVVNAEVRIDTIAVDAPPSEDTLSTAAIPADKMTTSPTTTTHRPVHARVRSTGSFGESPAAPTLATATS
jgi:hypothetical protein